MPGRLMSIKTRSGGSMSTLAMASSPDSASAVTAKPFVIPMTVRATSRNGRWSSTIRTDTVFVVPSGGFISSMVAPSPAGRQGASTSSRSGVLTTVLRQEEQHGLHPAVHIGFFAQPELREQRVDVFFDRALTQEQCLRDAGVVPPLRHLFEHFTFARGEPLERR